METNSSYTKTFMAVVALVASFTIAGCGNDDKADLVNGKTLFVEKCGACHNLARAGDPTPGKLGPDLDDAFQQARRDGMGDTVEGVVRRQIQLPSQKLSDATLVMPADLVTGMDARDVSAYVSFAAGNPGKDAGALADAGKPKTSNKTVAAEGGLLAIDADPGGATLFVAGKATAEPGALVLAMDNPSATPHNIAVKGNGVNQLGPIVGKGKKSEVKVNLKSGEYTFFCSVPGHEQGGMKGSLTVK